MIRATVGILTFNSSLNIKQCLESIKSFDEKIILDGNSVDATLNICKQYNCKIFKQPNFIKFKDGKIKNFSEARNILLKKASHDLIFFLDSDEVLSIKLLKRIDFFSKSSINKSLFSQYTVRRIGKLNNVLLSYSDVLSNSQPRIFFRNKNMKFIKNVHEKLVSKNIKSFKKTNLNEYIQYNHLNTFLKIKNKNLYYHNIEKNFMIKDLSLQNLKFIFFRIFINLYFLYKIYSKYLFLKNKKIINLQLYNIYLQIKLSIKLLL
jgi:glycosyltransferase involved in cell wall biosynthesis